jgi:hypothetical protein
MLKRLATTVLILSGLALAPAGAFAADWYRDRAHDRREFREHVVRRDRFYRHGYYDRFGRWHA